MAGGMALQTSGQGLLEPCAPEGIVPAPCQDSADGVHRCFVAQTEPVSAWPDKAFSDVARDTIVVTESFV